MKTDKARVFVIYNGETANPRIVQFNGYPIAYAEQVKVIEYTAVEQLEQRVKELEKDKSIHLATMKGQINLNEQLSEKLAAAEAKIKSLEWVAKDNNLRTYDGLTEKLAAAEAEIKQLKQIITKEPVYKSAEEYFATIGKEDE